MELISSKLFDGITDPQLKAALEVLARGVNAAQMQAEAVQAQLSALQPVVIQHIVPEPIALPSLPPLPELPELPELKRKKGSPLTSTPADGTYAPKADE